MREKRRKIPLEVILATPVSEYRKRHGKQVFAARLCKQGKLEQAQAYCAKNGLPFPPFSDKTLGMTTFNQGDRVTMPDGTAAVCVGTTEPLSDGVSEAGPVAREEAVPQEVASCVGTPPSETLSLPGRSITHDVAQETGSVGTGGDSISGVSHATRGEPVGGVRQDREPHETAAPASRKARIWAFCANPKLIRIKFEDGEKEYGSLWASRTGFRLNDIIDVQVERGSGPNAVWQEVRSRV